MRRLLPSICLLALGAIVALAGFSASHADHPITQEVFEVGTLIANRVVVGDPSGANVLIEGRGSAVGIWASDPKSHRTVGMLVRPGRSAEIVLWDDTADPLPSLAVGTSDNGTVIQTPGGSLTVDALTSPRQTSGRKPDPPKVGPSSSLSAHPVARLIAMAAVGQYRQCGPGGCSVAGVPAYAPAQPYPAASYYAASPCPGGCPSGAYAAAQCPAGVACVATCTAPCGPAYSSGYAVPYYAAPAVTYRATYQATYGVAPRRGLFGGGGFRPFRGLFRGGCCGGG